MVFSSLNFLLIFLPIVLLLHSVLPFKYKNIVLLAASIIFYAWGEPVYVILMILSIGFNYMSGLVLGELEDPHLRKRQLIFAVAVNLLLLGFFKYAGFLVSMINAILPLKIEFRSLALPVGISFYTFQALSYVIDVYRKKVKPQENLLNFAVYITMFPQLVAGPIVKYSDIELQLSNRKISRAKFGQGIERLLFGLSKKVLLANNLGLLYETIQASGSRSIMTSWLGIFAYTLQIYFDFSGYSDMAIGMGKMLGFTFPENFNFPYISDSITEFWRRWHITLGAWFKDNIFYPISLGTHFQKFSQNCRKHMNRYYAATIPGIFALFAVWFGNGIWHGAEWIYIIYGLYYYVIMVLGMLLEPAFVSFCSKLNIDRNASWYHTMQVVRTFILVNIGMLIFRSKDIKTAITMLGSVFQPWHGKSNFWQLAFNRGGLFKLDFLLIAFSVILLYFIGKKQENGHSIRELILAQPLPIRWAIYIIPIVLIIIAGAYGPGWGVADFIYAKF